MARLGAYADTTMPISDTMAEMWAAPHTYVLLGGCGVTLDAADLTYDVAAGAFMHSGTMVTVAAQANAGTLSADSSNPRWTWIVLDSSGVEAMVSGTAAATPAIPELGADTFPIMLVYVAAGATIASSQTNYDMRMGPATRQAGRCTGDVTRNASETLTDVTGVKFFMGASETWDFEFYGRATIGATPDIKLAFTVPASATINGVVEKIEAASIVAVNSTDLTTAAALASANAGIGIRGFGQAVNSTTAGWVQLQFAQNTSTAEDTIVRAGTYIVAHRVV